MKARSITLLLLILILAGCKNDANGITGTYSSMHFVRQGGGDINFKLSPIPNSDQLQAVVSRYNFRDTTINVLVNNNADISSGFIAFRKALKNEITISGDFQQSTLLTGSWTHLYMSNNGTDTEITNTALRNTLIQFEQQVRNKIR